MPLDALKPNRQASKQASRARRLARYEAVRALVAQGVPELRIARQLGLARATVRHFARAERFPERAISRGKARMIDPYRPYLQQRMAEGCTVSGQLWPEIKAQGYIGSRHQVARWVQQQRPMPAPTTPHRYRSASTSPAPISPSLPGPCQLVWCLLRADEERTDEEKANFGRIRHHPTVQTAYQLARQFQRMIRERSETEFSAWLYNCQASDIPDLQTFAAGLQHEESSIRLALSTAWSNGPTEGHVNRLNLIKRSMYRRATFDLLRIRIPAPTA
jgi:transposase